jgi:hypothetical protein
MEGDHALTVVFGLKVVALNQGAGVGLLPLPTHEPTVILNDLVGRIVGARFPGCIGERHIS